MTRIKGRDPARLWERYIRKECEYLRRQGRSDVRKNWEAPKVQGHLRSETSAPDFGGCAIINGVARSILFEAKRVKHKGRLPLSNVSDAQLEDLGARARLGGVAFIYVLSGEGTKHIVRVSEDGIPDFLSPREGSVILCDGNKKTEGITWLDYLETIDGL